MQQEERAKSREGGKSRESKESRESRERAEKREKGKYKSRTVMPNFFYATCLELGKVCFIRNIMVRLATSSSRFTTESRRPLSEVWQ